MSWTRKGKYNNKKTVIDGKTFDSKKEAQRYQELQNLSLNGKIFALECQKRYELIPKQTELIGKKQKLVERPVEYIADFYYKTEDGKVVVEDVKSKATKKRPEYIIKRKLMLYVHGIKISEV